MKEITNKTYGRTFYSKLFASTFNSSFWFQRMNQETKGKKYEEKEEKVETRQEVKFLIRTQDSSCHGWASWKCNLFEASIKCVLKEMLLLFSRPAECGFYSSTGSLRIFYYVHGWMYTHTLIYRCQTAYHCKRLSGDSFNLFLIRTLILRWYCWNMLRSTVIICWHRQRTFKSNWLTTQCYINFNNTRE